MKLDAHSFYHKYYGSQVLTLEVNSGFILVRVKGDKRKTKEKVAKVLKLVFDVL